MNRGRRHGSGSLCCLSLKLCDCIPNMANERSNIATRNIPLKACTACTDSKQKCDKHMPTCSRCERLESGKSCGRSCMLNIDVDCSTNVIIPQRSDCSVSLVVHRERFP